MSGQDDTKSTTETKDAVKATVEFHKPVESELVEDKGETLPETVTANLPPMIQQTQQDRFVEMALQSGDMEKLEKMLELKERFDKEEARKSFTGAMSSFKAEGVVIKKDRTVSFENNDKSVTSYTHASLGNVVKMAVPALAIHGLSHHWNVEQEVNAPIKVTCVLTHKGGHSEKVTMQAAADTSGKKNSIQQAASTVHYLQRYTFLSATGLAVEEMDDDGVKAVETEYITEDQQTVINDLIKETKADKKAFLNYCKVDSVEHLPVSKYDQAKRALDSKNDEAK